MFGAARCARVPAGAGLLVAELLGFGAAELGLAEAEPVEAEPVEAEPAEAEPAEAEPDGVEVAEAEPAGAEVAAGTDGLANGLTDGSATAEGSPAAMAR